MGDCFDFAMVLCSLLLGAGYDAYVVYGTAPGCVYASVFVPVENELSPWWVFSCSRENPPSFGLTRLAGAGGVVSAAGGGG